MSSSRDCRLPLRRCLGAERPLRRLGDEMALQIEGIVDDGCMLRNRWADRATGQPDRLAF
jgi:hypothetical protein